MTVQTLELDAQANPDGSVDISATLMDGDGEVVGESWPLKWAVVTGEATVDPVDGRTENGQAMARVTCADDGPVLISCTSKGDLKAEIQVGGEMLNG